MSKDVSVIIVNYNTKDLTINCLKSVYASKTKYSFEIILVDNASSDRSVQSIKNIFPEVRIIENKENIGFARANNQATHISNGRYLYVLNSDTEIDVDVIERAVSYGESNRMVGIIGTKVVSLNGNLQENFYKFPTLFSEWIFFTFGIIKSSNLFLFNLNKYKKTFPLNSAFEVDVISGTSMFVKREVYEKCGLFNEDFFMYYEDGEFCHRVKEAGFKSVYFPIVQVKHFHKGSSINSEENLKVLISCFNGALIYFKNVKNDFTAISFKIACYFVWFIELGLLELALKFKGKDKIIKKINMLKALLSQRKKSYRISSI
jgi:GT2 family glycosyltransferase